MTLKKPTNALTPLPDCLQPESAGDVLAAFPCLIEWLSSSKWEDGTVRHTSTLKMATEDGRWKLSLTDTHGGRALYIASPLLEEAMLSLEQALLTDAGDWQRADWARPRSKRKK